MSLDIAILNATVIDGTGADPLEGDVGIKDGRVVRVGRVSEPAKRYVDAFGKICAPGFIDVHGHSDYTLLLDPLARSKIYQGVTTEVGGNCGYHASPIFGEIAEERRREYGTSWGLDIGDWSDSDAYRAEWAAARPSMNYAQQIGYNTLRSSVAGDGSHRLSAQERDDLRRLTRTELQKGAVGLSYGIAYAPACFASTEELTDVAEEAAEHGAFVTFHMRDEGDKLIESLQEALDIGRASGARIHIGHLKAFRKPNWKLVAKAIGMIEQARAEGMDITVDRYPYLAMNTLLKFILPTWVLEGGSQATRDRLQRTEDRERVIDEVLAHSGEELDSVVLSLLARAHHKQYEGMSIAELGETPRDAVGRLCDILAEEGDAAFATYFGMSDGNLDQILDLDYTIVASDASIQALDRQRGGGLPHPRSFGTFPLYLRQWALDRGSVDLPRAIQKITSLPADAARLEDRGRLVEGARADVVVFDPREVSATVSYEYPFELPRGIDHVVVNGELVVSEGVHEGVRSGSFLVRKTK